MGDALLAAVRMTLATADVTLAPHAACDDVPAGRLTVTIACTIAVDGGSVDADGVGDAVTEGEPLVDGVATDDPLTALDMDDDAAVDGEASDVDEVVTVVVGVTETTALTEADKVAVRDDEGVELGDTVDVTLLDAVSVGATDADDVIDADVEGETDDDEETLDVNVTEELTLNDTVALRDALTDGELDTHDVVLPSPHTYVGFASGAFTMKKLGDKLVATPRAIVTGAKLDDDSAAIAVSTAGTLAD